MDYTSFDDAALIRLIAHQQTEALSVLYDRYGRLVYSIAYNSVGTHEIAEEIVQDVFTRVWKNASTYHAEVAKVSTWLISITRNRSIDELRRNQTRPEGYSVAWAELTPGNEPKGEGPEDQVDLLWMQKSIQEAIASLSAEQQQVLALAYYKGYSHSEIAEALGEPLGTVKTRIRLAMQKLRQLLSTQVIND